jgi:hypothetical protein
MFGLKNHLFLDEVTHHESMDFWGMAPFSRAMNRKWIDTFHIPQTKQKRTEKVMGCHIYIYIYIYIYRERERTITLWLAIELLIL